ncbi:MAG: hypothetical protein ACLFTT_02935 [Candidatus Hydrogenedentota bacterium]
MPRKFTRESLREAGRKYAMPFGQPARRRLTMRQRLTLIYIGIFVFVLFLLVQYVFQQMNSFGAEVQVDNGIMQAAGKIIEKQPAPPGEENPRPRLLIETALPAGGTVRLTAAVTPATFARLNAGDWIAVRYRYTQGAVELVDTGAVALPVMAE